MALRIPAYFMRGGTSKGLVLHERDLPADPLVRERAICAAYGSQDPMRQIDGIGGGISVASKVVIISPSADPAYDVVYNFGQVCLDRMAIEYKGNCGNMSATVGPFAVNSGLVKPVEGTTSVRIFQKNTGKLIVAEVPVKDGVFYEDGDCRIGGLSTTGSRIRLRFASPGGSLTGKLFPTGRRKDTLHVPSIGTLDVTLIDASNPVALVPAAALGLRGNEIDEIARSDALRQQLEDIRCESAVRMGLAETPEQAHRARSVPKIALVAPVAEYRSTLGAKIAPEDCDMLVRVMTMGALHGACAVSVAIATASAFSIEGTVARDTSRVGCKPGAPVRLGHPSGVIGVEIKVTETAGEPDIAEACVDRTARVLMVGAVSVPTWALDGRIP